MPARLLIIEDDDAIAAPLGRALEREGYAVSRVATGEAGVRALIGDDLAEPVEPAQRTDLVLLDLGLPDEDGLTVCRRVRAAGYPGAILILTARGGEMDRVVGLDVGADDYLAKPFSLSELMARIRALLRRADPQAALAPRPTPPPLDATAPQPPAPAPRARPRSSDGLALDAEARRAWVGGAELTLTAKEFDVLLRLDARRGAVVTRDHLIAEVWDRHWFGSTKTLDATVGRLRQKLAEQRAPVVVATVRGVGFRLEDVAADA